MKRLTNFINFDLGNFLVLAVLSLYLTLIWIPGGKIVGGGDVGIPTFLPQRILSVISNAWWETQSTGTTNPASFTAIPFYLILSFFDRLGVGADVTQKGFIFVILLGGSFSIYLLAREFSLGKYTSFLAALFFLFNLTTLNVWHRGVHNAMLMLLLMPLSLLFLVRGIKYKKYIYILWINLSSVLLSYVFGTPAYVAAIWILWLSFLFIYLIFNYRDRGERLFTLSYAALLFVSWVGLNFWWLYHFIEGSRYAFGQFSAEEIKSRSSSVLVALQGYTKPEYVLRGINAFYHYNSLDWGKSYLSPLQVFFSWIPTLIIFSTLLVKYNYRKTFWFFLIFLIGAVIFISKGVNAPLGALNRLAYDHIEILAPLRNPYEKVGILLVIPYSLLFALGISQIFKKIKSININLAALVIFPLIFISIGIVVWPIWKGEIFRTEKSESYFSVPAYYKEANDWLEKRNDDTRILHLPAAPGESVDYDWGYTGIEPNQLFFSGSSIAYAIGLGNVDALLKSLITLIHKHDTPRIAKSLSMLNVGWVVVHNETVWRNRGLEPVERINAWLESKPDFLEHEVDIGPLSIWRVKDEYRLGHFYPLGSIVEYSKIDNISTANIWDEISNLNDGIIINPMEHKGGLEGFIRNSIVAPKGKIKYTPLGSINSDKALRELTPIKHLPGSFMYLLVRIKESLYQFLSQDDLVRTCFSLSGKRLAESALVVRLSKDEEVSKALDEYRKQFEKCTQIDKETISLYLSIGFLRQEILGQLIRQRAVLGNEFVNSGISAKALEIEKELNEFMAGIGFHPKYTPVGNTDETNIMVFIYSIPEDGNYAMKFSKVSDEVIKNPPIIGQIDSDRVDLRPMEITDQSIVYPDVYLNKGSHEIHVNFAPPDTRSSLIAESLKQKQLNPDPGFKLGTDPQTNEQIFIGEAINDPVELSFDVGKIDIEQTYEITFDIHVIQGDSPEFLIIHDSEPLNKDGDPEPLEKNRIEFASYPLEWRNVSYAYTPMLNSTSAKAVIRLYPFNNCRSVYREELCEREEISDKFNRPTTAWVKNIRTTRMFSYDLFLEKTDSAKDDKLGIVSIKWDKVNPTLYELNLTKQEPPFILTFAETFHPMWQLTDTDNKTVNAKHINVNSFANAWLIEDKVPDKLKVQFGLQKTKRTGLIVSILFLIVILVIIFYLDYYKRMGKILRNKF